MSYVRTSGRHHEQIFVPYNGKIADITHADTLKHTLDLAAALSETRKIIAVQIRAERIAGTGIFAVYPNEGVLGLDLYSAGGWTSQVVTIKDGTQRLQYNQFTAGDDWDLYCYGYVVEA